MKNAKRIYELLIHDQNSILELLELMKIENPKEKIRNILEQELFEVVDCNSKEGITKIRKKSTGEIFEKGCRFYHRKYKSWVENLTIDESVLFGTYIFDHFFINYVRADGGMYHINEISLTEEEVELSDTINKYIKNKLFDLYQEHKRLNESSWVWIHEINGLSKSERILKNKTEIELLEQIQKIKS